MAAAKLTTTSKKTNFLRNIPRMTNDTRRGNDDIGNRKINFASLRREDLQKKLTVNKLFHHDGIVQKIQSLYNKPQVRILYQSIPMNSLVYLYALSKVPGIGSHRMKLLLDFFGTPENTWRAKRPDLEAAGIGPKLTEQFLESRKTLHPKALWEEFLQFDIQAITLEDPNYPKLLKEIPHPPYLLYKRGAFDWNSASLVTVVGSRRCTPYGKRVAQALARDLASAGVCVVSGLALGIDGIAHRSALEAGGPSVAVLGNSLDDASIAPHSHLNLAHSLIQNGALISEYPPVTTATPATFPARNRIMAGMALGTIVVEAAEKSGTLITARLALEFNREVFAVPGSIFSEASAGPHRLIRSGAKITTCITDILEELNLESKPPYPAPTSPQSDLSEIEQLIFNSLSQEPVHIDKILKVTKLETSAANSALAFLELKGLAKNVGGMNYVKM
jgi:DNA processing protein